MPPAKTPAKGPRREGRELALKMLYREEVAGLSDQAIPDLESARPQALRFAEELVGGVREDVATIDEVISQASEHWDISRMGAVDRTVLRIGVYELRSSPETPVGVIINEAVEIARKYSSEECGRFVNGVLDCVARITRGTRETRSL